MEFLPDRSEVVLRHIIERHAENQPEKECILFENGETWKYGQALEEAYKAANILGEMGIVRGENVLVFLPSGKDYIRAWWGITFLGAVIVPVNLSYKGHMLKHICEDSRARYMVASMDLTERLEGFGLGLNIIDSNLLTKGAEVKPKLDRPIEPWDIHGLIYTSGTTGPSKGVLCPYLHLYKSSQTWWSRATPDDTLLIDHPLFHVSGIYLSYTAWKVGARVALRTVFTGSRYLEVVRECGATMATLMGTTGAYLAASTPKPDDADNPLRVLGPVPMVRDPEAFKKRFGIEDLFTAFGMTEVCTPLATQGPIIDPKSCGKVVDGVEARLVDDHDIPVPIGKVGELIVRTDLPWEMNAGYWNRPEETAHAWRNGWFHTGDLFYCDEEGNYFFADRKKDAIRRRGENISSFEVEREVSAYPGVREAACVAVPGEFGEDEVKVFVMPLEASDFDPVSLIKFLIPRMPYFMVPRFIEIVPEFPKTPSMRVKKFELQARGNSDATWDREAAGIVVKRDS